MRIDEWLEQSGLDFVAVLTNEIIFKFGTDNNDDYYPSFECDVLSSNVLDVYIEIERLIKLKELEAAGPLFEIKVKDEFF